MLRHYERKGLFLNPPRSSGGYREYPASTVQRVRAIRTAIALGFSIDELAQIYRTRDKGGAPCRFVRTLAGKKLEAIEERLRQLSHHRELLASVLSNWDERLAKAAPTARVGLLDALADEHTVPSTTFHLEERFFNRRRRRR
jgi:DNA-binding transcriptional MerR regulator